MTNEDDIEAINDIESGNTEKITSGRDLINMVKRELDESIANAECKLELINLRAKYDKALAFIKRASLISYEIDGYTKHRRSYYLLEKEAEALLEELEGVAG